MMRKFSLLALISLTAGCVAEPGASIQLAHVMAPDQPLDAESRPEQAQELEDLA